MPGLRELADRIEIVDLCQRPHWAYDHDSWDDLDEVFTDPLSMPTLAQASEPGFDPSDYLGRFLVTRDEVKAGMKMFKTGLLTQHLVAGHHVDLRGDAAVCRAHSVNIHFPADRVTDETLLAHGNEYRFDCIRTPVGWRIRGWVPMLRWSYGNETSHDVAAKQQGWLDTRS
ncbi:nuclear transport factor 2 family protein [uncultured Jatrophihabitans sp.]|uniref:nuclear transport factor 2 family protein n=1 Tax=uncultured Jatrophihabitans sp. TaxID=1610747 RepID=UPI0035CB77D1